MTNLRQAPKLPDVRRNQIEIWIYEIDDSERALSPEQIEFVEHMLRELDDPAWYPTDKQWAWARRIYDSLNR